MIENVINANANTSKLDLTCEDCFAAGKVKTYLLAMESSVDGIAICGNNHEFTFMNKAHADMFGYEDPSNLIGKHWSILYDEEEIRAWKKRIDLFIRDGKWQGEAIATRRDGSKFPQEVSLTALHSGGIICICRDVSSRREGEESLKRLTEELVRSNRELEQFAYIASHDLREPLRMVASFVDLLVEENSEVLNETSQKYINFAQEGVARMQLLIRDLLTYSRVGRREAEENLIDLSEVIANVRANLTDLIDIAKPEISVGRLPTWRGNLSYFVQLFQILIENSIRYRGVKTLRIRISSEQVGDHWLFSVSDNGIGFNMTYHERIFQIFQRLHPRSIESGSGIGLSIAKKIVESYGGRIWAESKEGEGSTFYFSLPIRKRISRSLTSVGAGLGVQTHASL